MGCYTNGSNSTTGFGGSVYTAAKTVAVEKDSFQNGSATNNGGALYCASSVDGSAATVSGTSFESCSTTNENGYGGAIYSATKALTLQDYVPAGSTTKTSTTINACTAPGFSGAVHMATDGGVLNIKDNTVISGCYANMGGAIYLPDGVTMNLTDSPEFTQNGYTNQNDRIVEATAGACIYLEQNSRINISDSPKFSRNILPNRDRITNGGIYDNVRQDIFLAGYESSTPYDTNAASIYVAGELTGDTIWVWPQMSPHRLPNEQFAKIQDGVTVSDDTLSHFRNSRPDGNGEEGTHCFYGEYLAGVRGRTGDNVYWDKMYTIKFKKIDNKGVKVPGAGFTLY
jgi:predicted outer membrane repeat protein